MAKKALPCPTLLRQLLRYEPETGKLFWKSRPRRMFCEGHVGDSAHKRWNIRYAGKPALDCLRRGIRHGSVLGHSLSAHRVAWAIHMGRWPNHEIDHINGDASDNRIENLRDVTHGENLKNMGVRRDNSSGVTGVSFLSKSSRWAAQVSVNGITRSLGTFERIEDAISAREKANQQLGFHENHGRAESVRLDANPRP